jgi:hypothetical protein
LVGLTVDSDGSRQNVGTICPALDGLRQEKFNLNLLTDWIYFFLKSARGISQSTRLLWRNWRQLSNFIFYVILSFQWTVNGICRCWSSARRVLLTMKSAKIYCNKMELVVS